ncbi:phage tail tip lysozyme [Aureimonas phyllosphaerae]|uniref:phage tail tip lysozyme n=1 Tax=Aureimonas phyllosphaerae TaxID=1166078 RepID=UPI003A5C1E15
MADLAVLGLQIESDGALKASNDLDKLTASATKAEKATDSAGKASEQASTRMAAGSKAVERLLAAIEKVERAVRDQSAALGNMGGAMGRVEAQMEAASKAAQGVAASVSGAGAAATKAAAQVATLGASGSSAAAGIAATAAGAASMGAGLVAANQNVKLTSNQLLNLSRQANDAFTMLASGSDITQVFATQIGQVYGALEEGPQGLRGSLKALGSAILGLITPTTLAIAGLAAAAAAARYFGNDTAANMEKAEKAAKSYEKSIQSLKTAQGDLGGVMGRIFDRAMIQSVDDARRQLALLAQEQIRAKKAIGDTLVDAGMPGMLETLNPLGPMRELFRMGEGATNKGTFGYLGAEFEAGRRSAQSLREEVEKILLDDRLPDDLRELGNRMLEGAKQAAEVEARIKAITTAIREQKRELATENYKKATDAFDQFLPNNRTQREQIEQAYRERVAAIQSLQDNPRAMEGRMNTAEAQRLAALKEIDRQEEVMRQGRELDIKGINAQTVAERALLAAERERLALSEPGANKGEVERKASAASLMVYAQAEREAAEAARQARDTRDQAGLEGYAAQVAAVNAQFAEQIRLAEGSEAAVRDLTAARDAELEALEISTRRSLFSSQEQSLRQLQAEAGMIGMNDDARRVALATLQAEADLRRQGIDLNGAWGQSYVDNAREIATLENALDKQQEAFESLRDAAGDFFSSLSSGKGILESFVGAFAQLGNKLASQGFEKLFGGLFGASQPTGLNAGQIASGVGQALSQSPQVYTAPIGRVDRAPLPPLVTGEGFSASKAASVASQSVPARVWNFFAGKGLSAHQIAGIMGNARAESAFDIGARGDGGAALGLFQWNDRGPAMQKFVGSDWRSDLQGQLNFAWKELQTSESRAYRALLQATNVTEATEAFLGFERPHGYNTGVKNSHNYSGRLRFANEAYGEYGGSNVASSKSDARVIEKATATGTEKGYTRAVENYVGGQTNSASSAGAGLFGPRGQAGMSVLGAGLGAFGSGYQSGSPLSGGLSGALGGYQAGGAISSFLGIGAGAGAALGVVGGAALGILGGILGARKQREQAHRDKAAKWEELRPQYEAFDKSLSGDGNGQLRQWITEQEGAFAQFRKVGGDAWKYGQGNSSAQFASTGTKMWTRFMEMQEEFREGFTDMVEDLSSGEGLGGAFAKGRAATKDLKKQIKDMIDDVSIAFGSDDIGVGVNGAWTEASKAMEETRNKAIAEAKVAAGEYALSLLYTAETTSDVEKSLDGFRGTAAGLQKVLTDLGWTAEAAAADIDDRLSQAIAKMGETFVDGFQQQINDLSGKGYLNDIADLVKNRDTSLNDTKLLGVDPSIVTKWFELALQDIVSNADLTAQALEELKKKFPELAKVALAVTSKMQADFDRAVSDRAEAESLLRAEYERTVDRIKSITDFLSDIALDDNLSTLSGKEQFDAAQKAYRETLFKANGGDREAQDKLLGVGQDYLDEAKAYYATSEAYGAVYAEINSTLKASASKMETELDVARRQATFLEDIVTSTKGLSGLLADFLKAQSAVDKAYETINGNRNWGAMADQNKAIIKALSGAGIQYSGNFGGGQFLEWITQQSTKQQAIIQPIVDGIVAQFAGKSFALGGYTGPGGINEFAGMVHRGEVVWNQRDVAAWGGPARVDAMRVARMPDMPNASAGAGDSAALIAEVRELKSLMRAQVTTTGSGLQRVAVATEEGTRSSRQAELAARRSSNNKQAA